MPAEVANISNPQFALEFLIEANLLSEKGIDDVPQDFLAKHLKLVDELNNSAQKKIESHYGVTDSPSPLEKSEPLTSKKRKWHHSSVVQLLAECQTNDPIEEIKKRARDKVLYALENGWNGPPFSSIELAKILGYDIAPNDSVLDARTVPIGRNKFLIEYNPIQKPTRLNFSIAHEIAHTLFSDCYMQIRNREGDPVENRELEQLCNIGASELQLPYVVFPGDANAMDEITIRGLIDLAQKYKCSLESLLLGFIQAVDRSCAIMFCTFQSERRLVIDYYKSSSAFEPQIPNNFEVPSDSRLYYCTTPGWTESETVQWSFLNNEYDIFCVGISPLRKENKPRVAAILVPNNGREHLHKRRINIQMGDATKPRGEGNKIIAQVVNTSAALGMGFGKSLAKNFPIIKDALKKWKDDKTYFRLGESQCVQVTDDTFVFQMLAQNGLFPKNGKIPLEYISLQACLADLREKAQELNADVYMPLIGAGLAKGNWDIIEGLIYAELVNYNVKVNIYLFNNPKADEFKPKASLSLFNEESTWQKEK